jgi:hypothetical protein
MEHVNDVTLSHVSREDFEAEVGLWECKGHKNVIEALFDELNIMLIVPSYIYPEKAYFIIVTDDLKG